MSRALVRGAPDPAGRRLGMAAHPITQAVAVGDSRASLGCGARRVTPSAGPVSGRGSRWSACSAASSRSCPHTGAWYPPHAAQRPEPTPAPAADAARSHVPFRPRGSQTAAGRHRSRRVPGRRVGRGGRPPGVQETSQASVSPRSRHCAACFGPSPHTREGISRREKRRATLSRPHNSAVPHRTAR